jgi:hypothetical protein
MKGTGFDSFLEVFFMKSFFFKVKTSSLRA